MQPVVLHVLGVAAILAFTVSGQITYDAKTGSLRCPEKGGFFCLDRHPSMYADCNGTDGIGPLVDCRDALDDLEPRGHKTDAVCHESSTTAGDAGCYWRGTVHHMHRVASISTTVVKPANKATSIALAGKVCKTRSTTDSSGSWTTSTAPEVSPFVAIGNVTFTTVTMTITDTIVTKTLPDTPTMASETTTSILGKPSIVGIIDSGAKTNTLTIHGSKCAQSNSSMPVTSIPIATSTKVVTVCAKNTALPSSTVTNPIAMSTMENMSGQRKGQLGFAVAILSTLAVVVGILL